MRSLSLVCCCGLLVAQAPQTFIVDAANGPGTHFTDITAAVLAAPAGSVLLVRAGQYAPVVVDSKGMTILCDAGVTATWTTQGEFLRVRNTPASHIVAVRGLLGASTCSVVVEDALGLVMIDGNGALGPWMGSLSVVRSRQVALRHFAFLGSSLQSSIVQDSVVLFEDCGLYGGDVIIFGGMPLFPPSVGLFAQRSEVELVHTSAQGGNGGFFWQYGSVNGAEALRLDSSNVRVIGLATHSLRGGWGTGGWPWPAIVGTGIVRADPAATITSPTGPVVVTPMPSLVSVDAPPGGTLTAAKFGTAGNVFVLGLGFVGPVTNLPGIADPVWFHLPTFVVEAVGVTPASGTFAVQRPVPNYPGLVGLSLVWQAADLLPTGVIVASNPSPTVIR